MKFDNLSKEELVKKVNDFEKELKGYIDRVDQRYKVFYERNLAGIYRSKLNGEILDCNDAFAQILGYKSHNELIGTDAKLLYEDVKDRKAHLEILEKNKFVKNINLAILKTVGYKIWVSISTSVIIHPSNKNIEYLEGTLIDITELISTQNLLQKSEQNYKKMLDESPYGIIIHHKGILKYFNSRASNILKVKLKAEQALEKIFPESMLQLEKVKTESKVRHMDRVELKISNRSLFVDIYIKDVLFNNEHMSEFSFVDIKERIELEEEKIKTGVFKRLNDQLKEEIKKKEEAEKRLVSILEMNTKQSAKLEAIFENRSHIIWTSNTDFELTSFNQHFSNLFKRMLGFYPKIGDNPIDNYPGMKESARKIWKDAYKRVFEGESINFVSSSFNLNKEPLYSNIFLNPILDQNKKVIELSGIGQDITDKVLAEEKLNESLKEKDILLKEVHHRVKNNLQVISSIFNLQSNFNKDPEIREVLKESQNRIKSMAYIHESLYKSSQFGKIDFEDYLKMLCKNLLHSYTLQGNQISLLTETEKVFLDLDLAIPCGLIVNEIVSNSIKHAFTNRDNGIIAITLKKDTDSIKLRLADDGIGMPVQALQGESGTLGFQLIETLVEQIRGVMTIDNELGTSIDLRIPLHQ